MINRLNITTQKIIFFLVISALFLTTYVAIYTHNYIEKPSKTPTLTQDSKLLVTLSPPENGWDAVTKGTLFTLLERINYQQPTYLPPGFEKIFDINNNDFAIRTVYKNPNSKLEYDSLTFQQYPQEKTETKINSIFIPPTQNELEEKVTTYQQNNQFLAKRLTINKYPAFYIETPANPLDPYFSASFRGSEEEKLMRTEHEKYLYIFTPTTVLEFRLDYAYLISSEEAEQELVKMAESLQKGIVPSELALTPQENEKIEQESMRRMASDIKQLLKKYKQEHTFYVWENIENCPEPLATQATSPEFKPCLEQIEKYLLTNSFNHYNAQLLSNFFINASGQEDFYDPNFNTEEIEIIPIRKPYEPRICFKATIVSDYVARSLEDDQYPPQYVDGYPMFTREGTVDLSCRENPTKKECYYCTN